MSTSSRRATLAQHLGLRRAADFVVAHHRRGETGSAVLTDCYGRAVRHFEHLMNRTGVSPGPLPRTYHDLSVNQAGSFRAQMADGGFGSLSWSWRVLALEAMYGDVEVSAATLLTARGEPVFELVIPICEPARDWWRSLRGVLVGKLGLIVEPTLDERGQQSRTQDPHFHRVDLIELEEAWAEPLSPLSPLAQAS